MTQDLSWDQGIRIRAVDPDLDYLGIEIQAASERFAGTARIYAALNELGEFADRIAGFPTDTRDERAFDFGTPGPSFAGGHCKLRFRCIDELGHLVITALVEDDEGHNPPGKAQLSFSVEAAAIDRFVARLREVEQARSGEAVLAATTDSATWGWWRRVRRK